VNDLKQYDKAIADYTEAVRLKPDYAGAYDNRAFAYEKLGQIEKAKEDRAKAEQLK
jgi:tetratricopeptide (TPR) repeat protein